MVRPSLGCDGCPQAGYDIRRVMAHLSSVKRDGWGELVITVQNGNVVYIKHSTGEQVKMEIEKEAER